MQESRVLHTVRLAALLTAFCSASALFADAGRDDARLEQGEKPPVVAPVVAPEAPAEAPAVAPTPVSKSLPPKAAPPNDDATDNSEVVAEVTTPPTREKPQSDAPDNIRDGDAERTERSRADSRDANVTVATGESDSRRSSALAPDARTGAKAGVADAVSEVKRNESAGTPSTGAETVAPNADDEVSDRRPEPNSAELEAEQRLPLDAVSSDEASCIEEQLSLELGDRLLDDGAPSLTGLRRELLGRYRRSQESLYTLLSQFRAARAKALDQGMETSSENPLLAAARARAIDGSYRMYRLGGRPAGADPAVVFDYWRFVFFAATLAGDKESADFALRELEAEFGDREPFTSVLRHKNTVLKSLP
ncbi:MAG: hypothetical protein ACKVX7_12700 [Planctomycetota bacterium]